MSADTRDNTIFASCIFQHVHHRGGIALHSMNFIIRERSAMERLHDLVLDCSTTEGGTWLASLKRRKVSGAMYRTEMDGNNTGKNTEIEAAIEGFIALGIFPRSSR